MCVKRFSFLQDRYTSTRYFTLCNSDWCKVVLTFDGRITDHTLQPVQKVENWFAKIKCKALFGQNLVNPNGCDIRATWFSPFLGSTVDAVAEWLTKGHEIAARTFNDTTNPEPRDIAETRRLLAGLFDPASFPETEIRYIPTFSLFDTQRF